MPKRINSAAPELTRDDIAGLVGEITALDNKRASLSAEMNCIIDAAREKFGPQLTDLGTAIDEKTATVESWARANQDQFGSVRFLDFPRGIVGFRLGNWTIKALRGNTLKTVLDALKRSAWGQPFIRMKEEIDREALVAARTDITAEQAARAGFTFEQQDRFYVEPKQDKPAEVAS